MGHLRSALTCPYLDRQHEHHTSGPSAPHPLEVLCARDGCEGIPSGTCSSRVDQRMAFSAHRRTVPRYYADVAAPVDGRNLRMITILSTRVSGIFMRCLEQPVSEGQRGSRCFFARPPLPNEAHPVLLPLTSPPGCTKHTAFPTVPRANVVPDRSHETLRAWPIPTPLVEMSTVKRSSKGDGPSPATAHSRSVPSAPQVANFPHSDDDARVARSGDTVVSVFSRVASELPWESRGR